MASNIDAVEGVQGQKKEARPVGFAVISAQLGGAHYSLRGLVLNTFVNGSKGRLGMFELSVHQDSQPVQELLLTRPGLAQDNGKSGFELPKVRFDDPDLAGIIKDIMVV